MSRKERLSNANLAKMSSRRDLRKAQTLTNRELRRIKRNFRRERDEAKGMFTLGNMLRNAAYVIDGFQSVARLFCKDNYGDCNCCDRD